MSESEKSKLTNRSSLPQGDPHAQAEILDALVYGDPDVDAALEAGAACLRRAAEAYKPGDDASREAATRMSVRGPSPGNWCQCGHSRADHGPGDSPPCLRCRCKYFVLVVAQRPDPSHVTPLPAPSVSADVNDGGFGEAAYCHHRHHLDEHSTDFDTCPHLICSAARRVPPAPSVAETAERGSKGQVVEPSMVAAVRAQRYRHLRHGVTEPCTLTQLLADADQFEIQSDAASWYVGALADAIRALVGTDPSRK